MSTFRLITVLVALCAALSGCASASVASLDDKTPLAPGQGSFSLAIATDTSLDDNPWYWMYLTDTAAPKQGTEHQQYMVGLRGMDDSRVMVAYGALPAGKYTLSHLYYSYVAGKFIYTYFATLPAEVQIDITAGKHVDAGMLIYAVDLSNSKKLRYGWQPSNPVISAEMRKYVAGRSPAPAVEAVAPWVGDQASLNLANTFIFNNPAPGYFLEMYPDGSILVPAHLGRIMYRDNKKTWHVLDTGDLGEVATAKLLKDGRIVAAIGGGPVLVSDAAHTSWRKLDLPLGKVGVISVLTFGDDRLFLFSFDSYQGKNRNGNPIDTTGLGLYTGDADKGDWKLLRHVDTGTEAVQEGDYTYIYEAGVGDFIDDLGVSSKLTVLDHATGQSVEQKLPVDTKSIYPLGDGVLLLKPAHDLLDSSQYLSDDRGATWHEIKSQDAADDFEIKGTLIKKARGDYLVYARMLPPSIKYDRNKPSDDQPWKAGVYETTDYGQTWKYAFDAYNDSPCPVATLRSSYRDGKLWTLCENGEIWSYDPATRDSTKERATLLSATVAHNN